LTYNTTINFIKYGAFANITKSFFEEKVDISVGFRLDADNFTDNKIFKTFSPRASLSYEFIPSWKVNASVGRYYKLLPYTILGYRNQEGVLVNQNNDYTRSDHFVLGLSKEISKASSISLEGFYKKYSNYPISIRDGVSLANKGGGFEVLGNEPINSDGKGKAYGVELLFQQKLTKNFYGIFSYTFFYSQIFRSR
jgi:outer membrane receptor protein involved in Fe transport